MSLIEIHPDLNRASAALERIATALEAIALAEYGVAPKPRSPAAVADRVPSPDDDVSYASDEVTVRQELEQLVRPGAARERDGQVVEEELGNAL